MTRATYQKAGKDYPASGIKKGDMYWKWEFAFGGGTFRRLTPPRPSQLTQSKMRGAYAAGEALEDALVAAACIEDIVSAIEEAIGAIEEVRDEYQEGLDNMPDGLRDAATGTQEKIEDLEAWISDLESAKGDLENLDALDYEVKEGVDPENGGIGWDDLSEDGQAEMLDAARELIDASCPI
jgi:hypothetical protein